MIGAKPKIRKCDDATVVGMLRRLRRTQTSPFLVEVGKRISTQNVFPNFHDSNANFPKTHEDVGSKQPGSPTLLYLAKTEASSRSTVRVISAPDDISE